MKKNLIWLAITAAYMILIPYLLVTFAGESAMADAEADLADREWVCSLVAEERHKYLPMVLPEDPD